MRKGVEAARWLDQILEKRKPFVLGGGWANVLGPDEKQRVHDCYEPSRDGLSAVTKKHDLGNVFFSNVAQP